MAIGQQAQPLWGGAEKAWGFKVNLGWNPSSTTWLPRLLNLLISGSNNRPHRVLVRIKGNNVSDSQFSFSLSKLSKGGIYLPRLRGLFQMLRPLRFSGDGNSQGWNNIVLIACIYVAPLFVKHLLHFTHYHPHFIDRSRGRLSHHLDFSTERSVAAAQCCLQRF